MAAHVHLQQLITYVTCDCMVDGEWFASFAHAQQRLIGDFRSSARAHKQASLRLVIAHNYDVISCSPLIGCSFDSH